MSATQLAQETGVRQQNLSRWLQETRSVPIMADRPKHVRAWTVEKKVRVLAEASELNGAQLTTYLEREGVKLAEYEQWRLALDDGGATSMSTNKRLPRRDCMTRTPNLAASIYARLLVFEVAAPLIS